MYIASNDIKKYMLHPGCKIYVFQNTLMTSHECGATLIQTYYLCQSLPLSYPDINIPTSATIFVFNAVFDIGRSVRNVSGCT